MGRILTDEPLRPGEGILRHPEGVDLMPADIQLSGMEVSLVKTMVDNRINFAREIAALVRETYGSKIKVFGTEIPHSVRTKETSAEGKSIYAHDPGGKVAEAYKNLTKEVNSAGEAVVTGAYAPVFF